MRQLRIPANVDWELLVVNNNCTDDTDAVIARHQDALPLRRLFEPEQGLSNARNSAVAVAKGDYILWTDDDVLVSSNWLVEYANAFRSWPDAAFFGGPIEPWFSTEPPAWLK
jgi:glycosyltransferase involved in cell wall biosynthesis